MGYKPSIVERMNRGLNFQKRNSLLKKSSPFQDTDPHTGEGGHTHAGDSAGASTFSNVLPGGTRSTFQGSTTATFDPSKVETQNYVTGKNYLESTDESKAAYMALTPAQRKAQDQRALQLQAEENLRVQNVNDAIDVANQAKLEQAEQEFQLEQQNKATSQQFVLGDTTEAQEQQATMSAFETFQSELGAARTAALENAGDIFSRTYSQMIMDGDTPDEARLEAAKQANRALGKARYFKLDEIERRQQEQIPGYDQFTFEPGQQIQYVQGGRQSDGTYMTNFGGKPIFTSSELVTKPGQVGVTAPGDRRRNTSDATDLYGIRYEYFDNKGKQIDYDKYRKLEEKGKNPTQNVLLGPELLKYIQQFQQ